MFQRASCEGCWYAIHLSCIRNAERTVVLVKRHRKAERIMVLVKRNIQESEMVVTVASCRVLLAMLVLLERHWKTSGTVLV